MLRILLNDCLRQSSMPLPVLSRRYDDQFWKELLGKKGSGGGKSEKEMDEGRAGVLIHKRENDGDQAETA